MRIAHVGSTVCLIVGVLAAQTACTQPAEPPAAGPSSPAQATSAGERIQLAQAGGPQEVLARHNELRARHCVPPLEWSDRLAQTAQAWADRCVFEHSSNGLGENLAMGTAGGYSPVEHVQSWYDEIASYDFASGDSVDSKPTGHFTQVVWRSTTEVGCGWANCGGNEMLVCNYAPAGNMMGDYAQNVPPLCR